MEREIWKDVVGYEGLYRISSQGRLASYPKKRGHANLGARILKVRINQYGYAQKTLVKDKQRKTFQIHRLVALAFIPNPLNKPQVDHIDTNRANNNVENLRWVTATENNNNPITLNRQRGKPAPWMKRYGYESIKGREVHQYTLDWKYIRSWGSMQDAERALGITNISRATKKETRQAGGFRWSSALKD